MRFWRQFDHLSFSVLCFVIIFLIMLDASLEELLGMFLTGAFWTISHSYDFLKDPNYKISLTAKMAGVTFYIATIIVAASLILMPAYFNRAVTCLEQGGRWECLV